MTGLTQIWGFGSERRVLSDGSIILLFERVGSTMDVAREQVAKGKTEVVAVRAEYQSSGRGRSGSPWLAPPGACLLMTIILWPEDKPFEPNRVSLASAVALAEAIETITEGEVQPKIKWPNDILIGNLKVAGVLVEAIPQPDPPGKLVTLVGMGVNINIDQFPGELAGIATSLEIETGMLFDIDEMEELVRMKLGAALDLPFDQILAKWRLRDATAGRRYLAATPDGDFEGIATDISDSGALILNTEKGEMEVISATSIRGEEE